MKELLKEFVIQVFVGFAVFVMILCVVLAISFAVQNGILRERLSNVKAICIHNSDAEPSYWAIVEILGGEEEGDAK
jgi:hypothetical protein